MSAKTYAAPVGKAELRLTPMLKKIAFQDYNSQAVHTNATSSFSAINKDEKRDWLNK